MRALGGTIHMSHEAANLDGVDTVVYSSAIPQDHLEMVEARRRGLRVLHRSEALAAAMTGRRTVAVAGTHGKTTTTSMVTMVLQQAGVDPSFVIGGEISEVGSGAHHGTGEHFVVEADESDRSFLIYRPYVSIITNIEADHLNTYGDLATLEAAFAEFARLTDPDGFVITCADDPGSRRLAETLRAEGRRVCDVRRGAPTPTCGCPRWPRPPRGRATWPRSTAVRWARSGCRCPAGTWGSTAPRRCSPRHLLGLPVAAAEAALAVFPGVRRRFERKGVADGVLVYDEYAYHPTSMTAGPADAARGGRRRPADRGLPAVPAVPHPGPAGGDRRRAGHRRRAGAAGGLRPRRAAPAGRGVGGADWRRCRWPPRTRSSWTRWDDAPVEVARRARPGDVVVTMGAPPISLMGDQLLDALTARVGGVAGPIAPGPVVGPDGAVSTTG